MRNLLLPLLLAGCSVETGAGAQRAAHVPAEGTDLARAFGRPPPPACEGARVDLGALAECRCVRQLAITSSGASMVRAGAWCGEAFDGAVSSAVETRAEIHDAIVGAGAAVDIRLAFRNRATVAVPLRFRGDSAVHRVQVLDVDGRDVTRTGSCDHGSSRRADDHLVVVGPGGEASSRVRWVASHPHGEVRDGRCVEEVLPYAPGTYRLVLHSSLDGAAPTIASSSVTVTVR